MKRKEFIEWLLEHGDDDTEIVINCDYRDCEKIDIYEHEGKITIEGL